MKGHILRLLFCLFVTLTLGGEVEHQDGSTWRESEYVPKIYDANNEASFYSVGSSISFLFIKRPQTVLRVYRNAVVCRNNFEALNTQIDSEISWLERFHINGFWGMLSIVIIDIINRWAGRE